MFLPDHVVVVHLPDHVLVVHHGIKMRVKRWQVVHALVGLISLLFCPLPLGPGELGYDSRHAQCSAPGGGVCAHCAHCDQCGQALPPPHVVLRDWEDTNSKTLIRRDRDNKI